MHRHAIALLLALSCTLEASDRADRGPFCADDYYIEENCEDICGDADLTCTICIESKYPENVVGVMHPEAEGCKIAKSPFPKGLHENYSPLSLERLRSSLSLRPREHPLRQKGL